VINKLFKLPLVIHRTGFNPKKYLLTFKYELYSGVYLH